MTDETPVDAAFAELSNENRELLESWLIEFDQSWTKDRLEEWVPKLPPRGDRLRRLALVEMVRIDLERRWRLGQRARLEFYLHALPELGTPETVAPELIQAEIAVRGQFQAAVDAEEYARRFPRQIEALRSPLREAQGGSVSAPGTVAPTASMVAGGQETIAVAAGGSPRPVEPGLARTSPIAPQPLAPAVDANLVETLPFAPRQSRLGAEVKRLGRYRLIRRLGHGGMGAVYLADDTQLDRQVALKVPQFGPDDAPDALERFYREARAAATIEHPNLCRVYDVGAIEGTHFLTMEFIEGKSLAVLLKDGKPLTQRQAAVLLRKLALTLQEMHQRGVIHRDLKPANVMINRRGEPVIVDFGLAHRSNKAEARLTHVDTIVGTPAYMSPEQIDRSLSEIGPGSDIYSLGVILYELLAGRLPFQGAMSEMLARIVIEEPEEPSRYRADLDPWLESICLLAMSKRVDDRFATMGALATALGDFLTGTSYGPEPAGPAGTPATGVPEKPRTAAAEKTTESHLLVHYFASLVTAGEDDRTQPAAPNSRLIPRRRKRLPLWSWVAAAVILAAALAYPFTWSDGQREKKTAASEARSVANLGGKAVASTGGDSDRKRPTPAKLPADAAVRPADPPIEQPEPLPFGPRSAPTAGAVAMGEWFVVDGRYPTLVGADADAYQMWLHRMRVEGYRPTFVNGHDSREGPRFAAIAVRNPENAPWEARVDATFEDFQRTFNGMVKQYRPIAVSGYPLGATTGFASLYHGRSSVHWFRAHHDLDLQQYRRLLADPGYKGAMPFWVGGYSTNHSSRLNVLLKPDEGVPWLSRDGLSTEQLQATLDEAERNGYRPTSASAYREEGSIRFVLVMVRDPHPRRWEVRHGLSSTELREGLERHAAEEIRPLVVSGYSQEGDSRYLVIWDKGPPSDPPTVVAPAARKGPQRLVAREWFALQGRYPVVVGAEATTFQFWLDRIREAGYLPTFVNSYDDGVGVRFAAIAARNVENSSWVVRLDPTGAACGATVEELKSKYRPVCFSGHPPGPRSGFVSLWVSGPGGSWSYYLNTTLQTYQERLREMRVDKYKPAFVAGGFWKQSSRVSSLFVPDAGIPWQSHESLSADELKVVLADARPTGYHPTCATVWSDGSVARFALVMARDQSVQASNVHVDLSPAQLGRELNDASALGYRPLNISGYPLNDDCRYLAVWVKPALAELPMTGKAVPELAPLDRAMQQFMGERTIKAGTLAVMKDGRLVLERGYGFADRTEAVPIAPDAPLRLGGISRTFTAAVIRKLTSAGKLRPEARISALLETPPPAGRELDPRWTEVTVQHLLDHRGGWDSGKNVDPTFRSLQIATALGKPGPPTSQDIITFMAGQKLPLKPGTKKVASNFGYCLLGRVIEKVTGLGYLDALRHEILEPEGIKTIELARSLPHNRNPREPYYSDPAMGRSVMRTESRVPVPAPDGTFCLESMDSCGGLIGSAADVVRFLNAHPISAEPRPDKSSVASIIGSLPGSFALALQRPDGAIVAALFNQSRDESQLDYASLKDALDKAVSSILNWPSREGGLPDRAQEPPAENARGPAHDR